MDHVWFVEAFVDDLRLFVGIDYGVPMDNTLGFRACGSMVFGSMCDHVIALWVLTYI